jgi:hypothetical protein
VKEVQIKSDCKTKKKRNTVRRPQSVQALERSSKLESYDDDTAVAKAPPGKRRWLL